MGHGPGAVYDRVTIQVLVLGGSAAPMAATEFPDRVRPATECKGSQASGRCSCPAGTSQ